MGVAGCWPEARDTKPKLPPLRRYGFRRPGTGARGGTGAGGGVDMRPPAPAPPKSEVTQWLR
jgi:hypothetical protein